MSDDNTDEIFKEIVDDLLSDEDNVVDELSCDFCGQECNFTLDITEANVGVFNPNADELLRLLGRHCATCFGDKLPQFQNELRLLDTLIGAIVEENEGLMTQSEMHRLYGKGK